MDEGRGPGGVDDGVVGEGEGEVDFEGGGEGCGVEVFCEDAVEGVVVFRYG